ARSRTSLSSRRRSSASPATGWCPRTAAPSGSERSQQPELIARAGRPPERGGPLLLLEAGSQADLPRLGTEERGHRLGVPSLAALAVVEARIVHLAAPGLPDAVEHLLRAEGQCFPESL